jgi:hypothetical protein
VGRSLERSLADEVEAARNTIKLLDDDQRTIDTVLTAFEEIAELHSARFSRGADVSLFTWNGSPITTSRAAEYQTIASVKITDHRGFGYVMGQSMIHILNSGLGAALPPFRKLTTPPEDGVEISDVRASSFYPSIYNSFLSTAEKDLLLTVESGLQAAVLYRRLSGEFFAGPVFRAQLLTLAHAVSTLKTIAARHSDPGSSLPDQLLDVVQGEDVVWLAAQKSLRNRSMHYGVPPSLEGVSETTPMYGLVEATTGRPFSEVSDTLVSAADQLGTALATWRSA